jgi:hypothetical protein
MHSNNIKISLHQYDVFFPNKYIKIIMHIQSYANVYIYIHTYIHTYVNKYTCLITYIMHSNNIKISLHQYDLFFPRYIMKIMMFTLKNSEEKKVLQILFSIRTSQKVLSANWQIYDNKAWKNSYLETWLLAKSKPNKVFPFLNIILSGEFKYFAEVGFWIGAKEPTGADGTV